MLTLRNIIKTVATRCQILRLRCIKFDFGWGSAPDPTGGAYSAPQTPSCDALLLRAREGRRGREERGGEMAAEKGRRGRVGEGKECDNIMINS